MISPPIRIALQISGLFLLLLAGYAMVRSVGLMFDYKVYIAAIDAFRAGDDPYDVRVIAAYSGVSLDFVYPPHALAVAAVFAPAIESRPGQIAQGIVYVLTILSIPWLQQRWLLLPYKREWPLFGFFLFFALWGPLSPEFGPFGFAGLAATAGGSVTLPLYAMILAALWYALATGRWFIFYLAVLAAAQVKPTYCLMLAYPLMLAPRPLLPLVLVAIGSIAPLVLDDLVAPHLFHGFLESLHRQTLFANDVGQSFFGLVCRFYAADYQPLPPEALLPASLAQGLLMAVLGGGFLWLRRPLRTDPHELAFRVAWIAVAIAIANPRMKGYDICIGSLPFGMLTLTLLRERGWLRVAYGLALLAILLVIRFQWEPAFPAMAYFTAWVAGAVRLARMSPEFQRPPGRTITLQ